jgi:hypothetical protein
MHLSKSAQAKVKLSAAYLAKRAWNLLLSPPIWREFPAF